MHLSFVRNCNRVSALKQKASRASRRRIHLARPNLAKTSIWNTLQDISGSSSSTLLDGTTSIVVGISARRTDGVKAARSLAWLWTDGQLFVSDEASCIAQWHATVQTLFYIAVSTVYSTYTTQNCFCPLLLSFLRPIHIHRDATQLPYTNAILSRRWLSSVETFVNIRLSAGVSLRQQPIGQLSRTLLTSG